MKPLARVLLVTDRRRMRRPIVEAVRQALEGLPGAAVLLREKDLDGKSLAELAHMLREVTAARGALLYVAGRIDVALAVGADGVSLGHEAPACADVRALAGELTVGVALHGSEVAPAGATFALVSPVFETASKPGVSAIGLEALARRVREVGVPVYALGGVTAQNAAACLAAGAAGVAIVGSVLGADDPRRAAEALAEALEARPRDHWPAR